MRTLKTREAATLLNVTPNTLRTWERKFRFPRTVQSAGGHRSYTYAEIVALRDALARGLSVPSAISAVREGIGADVGTLLASLSSYQAEGADRAMESSLALRSLERSVEELLLPALDEIRRRGPTSTAWAAACRWGLDWLGRARRLAPTPEDAPVVLVGDATGGELSATRPGVRALELFLGRAGLDVLCLPVGVTLGLADAATSVRPACIVLAGSQASDEQTDRWLQEAGRAAPAAPVALFLRPATAPRAEGAHVLSSVAIAAQRQIVRLVTSDPKPAPSAPETNRLAQSG